MADRMNSPELARLYRLGERVVTARPSADANCTSSLMSVARKQLIIISLLACTLLLGAWVETSPAAVKCCYRGDVVGLRLAEVTVNLEDGRTLSFGELFPDFAPSTSFFTRNFPVYRLDIARVVYPKLAVILALYDINANDNGVIEEPELTVLYMREAALGLDQPVTHLGGKSPLWAIFATSGDIDGLIRLVNRRRSEMTPAARQTFDELDLLRRDFRLDGTEPGEQGDGGFGN